MTGKEVFTDDAVKNQAVSSLRIGHRRFVFFIPPRNKVVPKALIYEGVVKCAAS